MFDDPACVHDTNFISQPGNHRQIMGDPNQGCFLFPKHFLRFKQNLCLNCYIESCRWLIGNKDGRSIQHRNRNRYALSHSS